METLQIVNYNYEYLEMKKETDDYSINKCW